MLECILWLFGCFFRQPVVDLTEVVDFPEVVDLTEVVKKSEIDNMIVVLFDIRTENRKLQKEFSDLKKPLNNLTVECAKAHNRNSNLLKPPKKNRKKRSKPANVQLVKTSTSVKKIAKLLEAEMRKKKILTLKIERITSFMNDVNIITIFESTRTFIQLKNLYNIVTIFNTSYIGDICMAFSESIHFKIIVFTQPNSSKHNQKQQIFFCTAQRFNITVEKNSVTIRTTEKKEEWFTRKKCISCKTQFSFKDSKCSNARCRIHSNFCEFMTETVTIKFCTPFLSMRVIGDSTN